MGIILMMPFSIRAEGSAELSITPVLIDEKAKPRDILKEELTIVNTSNRKLNLYPSVNDIDPNEGKEGFVRAQNGTDRSVSLANWVELSRGVIEISPGEEKRIPFVIRVHLNAVPDTYHAYISFHEGSTRESAEKNKELANIAVNVEVQNDVKEVLQLNKFFTDNIFFSGDDVLFNFQVENIGNQDLQPKGEIRVYDRKGKEVASIPVNDEGKKISPTEMSQLASVWTAASGFGKYKAFLNVDYGSSQKASVQDTVYFWILPWQQLLGLFVASVLAVIFLALYVHKRMDARHHPALAGVHMDVPPPVASKPLFARAPEPTPAPAPIPAARSSLRDVLPDARPTEAPRAVAPVHTVDLKNLHQQTAPVQKASHVINLKG